jgi:uncharacterized protein YbjT (DUF2867 family)
MAIDDSLLCRDLPSQPQPEMGTILVTGATGYIGGRLVPELLARGYRVRVMVRAGCEGCRERWPGAEVVVADALDAASLRGALQGIHAAYYLIHSLLRGHKEFEVTEIQAAGNFRRAADEQGVARIIYLGALGDIRTPLSPHLRSRIQVAQELGTGSVATTFLRAAVIIGSGSASYEILEHLVKNLPIVPVPYWAQTRCQPIAVRDVIKYLVGVLETPETAAEAFDIGGQDVLTYREMMAIFAELLGKKRLFVPCPFSNVAFFAYVASLLTPVPAPITRCLMQGSSNEVVCQNDELRRILPFTPLGYREAIVRAMSREEQDNVRTRWSDAYPPAHELAMKLHELREPVRYTSSYSLLTEKDTPSLFRSICRVGGKEGWFSNNWMWRLRGAVDRILLGVGSVRGRRSLSDLRVGDVIDFWRVESLKPDAMLLLRAEMRLPGKAWLQFNVDRIERWNRLSVNAYYRPNGLLGKLYWYAFLPFHFLIFRRLIEQIEKRS